MIRSALSIEVNVLLIGTFFHILVMGSYPEIITVTYENKEASIFQVPTYGASVPHKMRVSNCTQDVVGGYLKTKCLINNRWYYKCVKSNRYYRVMQEKCPGASFSRICPNDTTFYQACGHNMMKCARKKEIWDDGINEDSIFGSKIALCGKPICQIATRKENSGYAFSSFLLYGMGIGAWDRDKNIGITVNREDWNTFRCGKESLCSNKIGEVTVDQYGCNTVKPGHYICAFPNEYPVNSSVLCDGKCDCNLCDDEAKCNNMTVGLFCKGLEGRITYVSPSKICDGVISECANGMDEKICRYSKETCKAPSYMQVETRVLTPLSKCSVPDLYRKICHEYRDQMNCSYSNISPLTCNVDGYLTTVSTHVICKGLELCDDGLDNRCVEAEFRCKVHKHRLCDGVDDCPNKDDEGGFFCQDLIPQNVSCVRRFSYDKIAREIPQDWIMDGVADCVDFMDENPEMWAEDCGFGTVTSYTFSNPTQSDCNTITQLKCPNSDKRLNLDRVCLGKRRNCDFFVCIAATKEQEVISRVKAKPKYGNIPLLYCIKGLRDLTHHAGKCSEFKLIHQKKVMGINTYQVITSETYTKVNIDCRHIFGEYYVYVSCTGHCNIKDACPLKNLHSKCLNIAKSRHVFSLAEDGTLAIAITDGKRYNMDYFKCDNGICIDYDKVCNLDDDCQDESDEKNCINNFKCKSGEYIPFFKKCDGAFDCFDYSDECNDMCKNQVKMFNHLSLLATAWVFGISATSLNVFTLVHGLVGYRKLKKGNALINKFFVLMITFGDLLQGVFLLILATGDTFFNKSTCRTQFQWTTSELCSVLGVLSTIGSLVSLYSITILSLYRTSTVGSLISPTDGLSGSKKLRLMAVAVTVFLFAVLVAIFPEIMLEDYFVQNLYYEENPIFMGAPNKGKHLKIFESYFARIRERFFRQEDIPWKSIRYLVEDMFHNDRVKASNIGFYGGNGFCLFSYFVRSTTPYRWFSMTVLFINLVCVLTIGVCYIMIIAYAKRCSNATSTRSNKNAETDKNNRKLGRKIAIIVGTDVLTWLPFIIVCIINFSELIDASNWYSVFCILLSPINALINPIGIYDETIYGLCRKLLKELVSVWGKCADFVRFREVTEPEELEMVEQNAPTRRREEDTINISQVAH